LAGDLAVSLHCDTSWVHFEKHQKAVEENTLGYLARMAVYDDFNCCHD